MRKFLTDKWESDGAFVLIHQQLQGDKQALFDFVYKYNLPTTPLAMVFTHEYPQATILHRQHYFLKAFIDLGKMFQNL